LSIKTYHDMDGIKGDYEHVCYGRKFSVDRVSVVTCILSDKRTTHWAPEIQK